MTYRFVDHTAELELRIEAPHEPVVFAEAVAALAELIGEDLGGDVATRRVELRARDSATLLADLLEELVFLAEAEDFVAERVVDLELDGSRLNATVEGRIGRPRHLVKAVTYHGLDLRYEGGAWHARVVLDV
jgi:SHS2 domain-containing protein